MNDTQPPVTDPENMSHVFDHRLVEWIFQSEENPSVKLSLRTSNLLTALNNKQNLPMRLLQELHQTHVLYGIGDFYDIRTTYGKSCYLDIKAVPQKNGKTVLTISIPEKQIDIPYWLKVPVIF